MAQDANNTISMVIIANEISILGSIIFIILCGYESRFMGWWMKGPVTGWFIAFTGRRLVFGDGGEIDRSL